jgi:cystathionine beta-lyase family protein involved in aluminum resistance
MIFYIVLPKKIDTLIPWDTVHMDISSPYRMIALQNKPGYKRQSMEFCLILMMTLVDPVTPGC